MPNICYTVLYPRGLCSPSTWLRPAGFEPATFGLGIRHRACNTLLHISKKAVFVALNNVFKIITKTTQIYNRNKTGKKVRKKYVWEYPEMPNQQRRYCRWCSTPYTPKRDTGRDGFCCTVCRMALWRARQRKLRRKAWRDLVRSCKHKPDNASEENLDGKLV